MTQVYEWEPGTWYGAGTVVLYRGIRYKIIQPHTSEPGWEPPATPALWSRMQEESGYEEDRDYGGSYQRGADYSEGYGSQDYGEGPRRQIYADPQQPSYQQASRSVAYEGDVESGPRPDFDEGYNPSYIKPGQLPTGSAYGGPGQSASFQPPPGPPPPQVPPSVRPPTGPQTQGGYGADRGFGDSGAYGANQDSGDQGYDRGYGGGPAPIDQGYDKGYGGNQGYGGPPVPAAAAAPPPVTAPVPPVDEKAWDQHQEQQVEIHHEERKKNWYDLDPKRKKQLEIGGGLALGVAALGAGYYAFHSHQKTEEEKKAHVWALQNWLQEAETRTQAYYNNGPSGPVTWILAEGGKVPEDALPGGEQHGQPLFICRGYHEGGLQIGKVSPGLVKGGIIGFGFKEIEIPKYEVLVGDRRALRWVDVRGRLNHVQLGARPVEGGREADGTPLFIAKVHHHNNAVIPGKAGERLDGAVIPVNNTEEVFENYRVLCYA